MGTEQTPVAPQGQETDQQAAVRTTPRVGEWVITVVALVFFATAYLLSEDWPAKAALFPKMVSVAGFLLTVVKLVTLVRATVSGRRGGVAVVPSTRAAELPQQPGEASEEGAQVRTAAVAGSEEPVKEPTDVTLVDDEQEDDESMEYVFATAGSRAWIEALAWVATFFISFAVLGAFVTVPVFALFYLKFAGKASWLSAGIYALVTGALIYVIFREVVFLPLPTGLLPFLQGI
jgi:hypothetical protein